MNWQGAYLFSVLQLQQLICDCEPEVSIVRKRQLQQLIEVALSLMHAMLGVRVCLQMCTADACFHLHHIVLQSSGMQSEPSGKAVQDADAAATG